MEKPMNVNIDDCDINAGDFASWIVEMRGALRGEHASDVPCDGCTACCTSSQFIHIGPDETDTLAHIPAALTFPAPGLPAGHVVVGYDERGHCPMLIDERCSIYEHRPRTCRTYDCRVFAASGTLVADDHQALVARRAQRWQFSYTGEDGRIQHEAVRAAAAFLGDHADQLPGGTVPTNTTQIAVLAIELHDVFLRHDPVTGDAAVVDPRPDAIRVELRRRSGARDAP
jgi:Fe-S-cluster containining protein